jgi:hypothetical protein
MMNPMNFNVGRKDPAIEQSPEQPGCGAACEYVVQRITELGVLSPLEMPRRRDEMASRPPYSSFDPMTIDE